MQVDLQHSLWTKFGKPRQIFDEGIVVRAFELGHFSFAARSLQSFVPWAKAWRRRAMRLSDGGASVVGFMPRKFPT